MKIKLLHYLAMLSVPFFISCAMTIFGFISGFPLVEKGVIDDAFRDAHPYLDTGLVHYSVVRENIQI